MNRPERRRPEPRLDTVLVLHFDLWHQLPYPYASGAPVLSYWQPILLSSQLWKSIRHKCRIETSISRLKVDIFHGEEFPLLVELFHLSLTQRLAHPSLNILFESLYIRILIYLFHSHVDQLNHMA